MAYKDSYYVNRINFNNIKSKQIKSNEYYKILFIFENVISISLFECFFAFLSL